MLPRVTALLLLATLACNHLPVAQPAAAPQKPVETLVADPAPAEPTVVVMHADTEFTQLERSYIATATGLWNDQTSGMADIRVVYDVDFYNMESLRATAFAHQLMRAESWMELVVGQDAKVCAELGGQPGSANCPAVLGEINTFGGIHATDHVKMFLVVDRISKSPNKFISVAAHEFGHVLGLAHTDDEKAIMYGINNGIPKKVCLHASDLLAFCTMNECGTAKLYPCKD